MSGKKNMGVALSGSGFLGVLHIGGLNAIENAGYRVAELSGTSGGAIVAALYASGIRGINLKNLFGITDFSDFLDYHYWRILFGKTGFCNGDTLLSWLMVHTGGKTFSEIDIPLTVMATDLTNGTSFKFSKETTPDAPVALAARASSAIPILYDAVIYKGRFLQDGGMVCNIPTNHLSGTNRRIGLEVVEQKSLLPDNASWIRRGEQAISLMLSANEGARVAWAEETGVTIVPLPSLGLSPLDRMMTHTQKEDLYNSGYQAVSDTFKH